MPGLATEFFDEIKKYKKANRGWKREHNLAHVQHKLATDPANKNFWQTLVKAYSVSE